MDTPVSDKGFVPTILLCFFWAFSAFTDFTSVKSAPAFCN